MAITSSAGAGITITTPAANVTLGDQSQANGIDEIVFSNTLTSIGNGNLEASATFPERTVILRRGSATEEVRYMVSQSAGTGTTLIVVCSEPWVIPPASGDTADVAYYPRDAATVTSGWSLLSKRLDDYTSGRRFTVGTGAAFAYFFLGTGKSYETVDNSSTTVPDIRIETAGGRMDIGYIAAGKPVSGSAVFGAPQVAGEFVLEVKSGGTFKTYGSYWKNIVQSEIDMLGDIVLNGVTMYGACRNLDLTGIIEVTACSFEGRRDALDVLYVDDTTEIVSLTLSNTYGFDTPDTTARTIVIRATSFVSNLRLLRVQSNQIFRIIDPVWTVDTSTQADIDFVTSSTSNSVQEEFSFQTRVTTPAGLLLRRASVFISEHLLNGDIPNEGRTDSLAEYSTDILKRVFTNNADTSLTVALRGLFALKVYKYGRNPFVGGLTVTEPIIQPIGLTADASITETDQHAALVAGNGITVSFHRSGETDPREMSVIHFDGGSGTIPSVGDTIQGGTSSAEGDVVEIVGDNTEGYLVLKNRNANAWQNNEDLTDIEGGATWTGVADTSGGAQSFYKDYTVLVDCASENLPVVYDYLAAHMAQRRHPLTLRDDGGVFTDYSSEAISTTAGDVQLTPASPATNDAAYFGNPDCGFEKLTINISSAMSSNTLAWEYWSGSAWSALGSVSDGTTNFTTSGTNNVTYTMPANWKERAFEDGVNKERVEIALLYDSGGATYTDETDDAESTTINDVTLLPSSGSYDVGDAFYVGARALFESVEFTIGTAGSGAWAITWEYWNGATWSSLSGVSDGTSAFKTSGTNDVSFTIPADWAKTSVNGSDSYFFIRGRVTTGEASPTTRPLGSVIQIDGRFAYWIRARITAASPSGQALATQVFIDNDYDKVILWGADELAQLMYAAGAGYVTERNTTNSEGVWLANRGTGTLTYLTSDDGTQFAPPQSVTIQVTVADASGPIENASVYVQAAAGPFDDTSHIMRELTNASGIASEPYTYTSPVNVVYRVRKKGYKPFDGTGQITGDFSVSVLMNADPAVE